MQLGVGRREPDTTSNGGQVNTLTLNVPAPRVKMSTSKGDITLELYPNNAPQTARNFIDYVNSGFYTNKIFHRVISDLLIQGGGFDAALNAATTKGAIPLEVGRGLSNLRGTVAMARGAGADSAASQFFINVVDNTALDTDAGGYAVFGMVVAGLDVVDAIRVVPIHAAGGMADVPVTPVIINALTQVQ
jgi:cyclophilin family peptidyl-prolyl cis-trans isomerase